MSILKMAWRNVWRNYRRSLITIVAMIIALVVELLYAGLVTGLVMGMEDDATSMDLGDIQIFAPQYLTRPSLYDVVEDHEAITEELRARGYHVSPRLFSGGLAASGDSSAGVGFLGLDPVQDAEVLDLHQAVGEGEWLDESDPEGVLVGRGLARTLGLELGSEVVVLSQAADGSVANALFRVRGILQSVAAGMDRSTILMTEGAFRELMVLPEGAHKLIIRRPADVELEVAVAEVEAQVAGYPVAVKSWKELNPFLAQYLDQVAGIVTIFYLIIYLAVAILILNAMLMAVYERIREFGVLKALGYGPLRVLVMMVFEGMLQAVIAFAVGLSLAAPGMWYLTVYGINAGRIGGMELAGLTMPAIWRADYSVGMAAVPVVLLFVIVFVAVIIPAVKAARISPVEAMQHQ